MVVNRITTMGGRAGGGAGRAGFVNAPATAGRGFAASVGPMAKYWLNKGEKIRIGIAPDNGPVTRPMAKAWKAAGATYNKSMGGWGIEVSSISGLQKISGKLKGAHQTHFNMTRVPPLK